MATRPLRRNVKAKLLATTTVMLRFTDQVQRVSFTNDASDSVVLPKIQEDDIGKVIKVYAVQGCEVISAEAAAKVNNVTVGATNELALVAGTYVEFRVVALATWLTTTSTLIDGTQTKLVPDVLA